jgi:isovaleryl-CoA dehydrogenase
MELELTPEQRMIQKNTREFMKKKIEPVAGDIDRDDRFPEGIWKTLGSLGFLGIALPEEYGGTSCDTLTFVLVLEQMGRVCPALGLSYGAHTNLCAHNLARNGSPELKRKYLPGLISGDRVGAMGLTEPEAGSDAVGIQTRAHREGDHYLLNGSKTFITNALEADVFLVYAKTDPEKRARGISAFFVEKEFPGFSVSGKIEKMGNRGSTTGELAFNNCRVPVENRIGEENEGIRVMMNGLDVERTIYAGLALGLAEGALEQGLQYSRKRKQFQQPICEFQLIKAKLADMYTEIEAARSLVYRTAAMADRMEKGGKGTAIHRMAAASILFAAETASRCVDRAVQIHGGYGYTTEFAINRFYRDAKLYEIGAGTSEVRRIVIADEIIQRGLSYA